MNAPDASDWQEQAEHMLDVDRKDDGYTLNGKERDFLTNIVDSWEGDLTEAQEQWIRGIWYKYAFDAD